MTVILNTEDVNRYGYRILSAGIDYRAFKKNPVLLIQHDTYSKEALPIGKVNNIRLDGTNLIGDIEWDTEDELAMKIKGKYERKFMNAFSIQHDPKARSEEPAMLLKGQTRATVTKTELLELSTVKVPGNGNAVRLSVGDDNIDDVLPLLKLSGSTGDGGDPPVKTKPTLSMKSIALKLGLAADATEAQIEAAVGTLQTQLSAQADQRAEDLVSQALAAGKITEENKPTYLALAKGDYDSTSKVLSSMKSEKTEELAGSGMQIQDALKKTLAAGGSITNRDESDAARFERLMNEDPAKLEELEKNDKETFERLAAAFVAPR